MKPIPIAAAALVSAVLTAAQQGQPTIRSQLNLIHIDVSVIDQDRRPVKGLRREDFIVEEDGRRQNIAVFTEITVPRLPAVTPPPWRAKAIRDVSTNEPVDNPEGRLFVILIDDAMLPGDPWTASKAREIARGVVDRLGPIDQAAVVFTFASHNSQGFTTDKARLLSAIDTTIAGAATHLMGWDAAVPRNPTQVPPVYVPAVDTDAHLRLGSVRTLWNIAESLTLAPQRRKLVVYISPGVTLDQLGATKPRKPGLDPGVAIRENHLQTNNIMKEAFAMLQLANVNVYSIDPSGVGGLENYIAAAARGLPSLQAPKYSPPADFDWLQPNGTPRPSDLARRAADLATDFLLTTSRNTGGRALINTNEFEAGLDGIFAENESYYLLAYEMPARNRVGSLHRISVKVNRRDISVRARSSYEVQPLIDATAAARTATEQSIALRKLAANPTAVGDLPLSLALSTDGSIGHRGNAAVVTIIVGTRQKLPTTSTPEVLSLLTMTFTPDGRQVGSTLAQTAKYRLSGAMTEARHEVLTSLPVAKPGRYTIRVAARRESDGAGGSVYGDIDVPDYAGQSLSMSGIWIEVVPGATAIPRDGLATILPIVPTAIREFGPHQKASAFARVHQRFDEEARPVALVIRILDEAGRELAHEESIITADRFGAADRAADVRFEVPLGGLLDGTYLLRIEGRRESVRVHRDMIFSVRQVH